MTKIINIHTREEVEYPKKVHSTCSICETPFVSEDEGGVEGGAIGMIPVNFCPYCLSGILDMAKQLLVIDDEKK
tara:strand:+ start:633 stop:854 length:222 start_codon:yes stop_codon:yes gene_type:complete